MKEIAPLLEKLAVPLNTTVEYLWATLVRQAPISSIINIIEWVIMGVVTWLAWKVFKKIWKEAYDKNWDEVWLILPIIIGVVFLIFWIMIICTIPSTIAGFINPEYWALKQLLDAVSK